MLTDTFVDGKLLDKSDLSLLCAYTLKVEDGLTDKTFSTDDKVYSHIAQREEKKKSVRKMGPIVVLVVPMLQ